MQWRLWEKMRNKYYVQGCIDYYDDDGYALTRRAEDDEIPDLWSVYEVQEDGPSLCIADFWDVDRAQEYVKWLMADGTMKITTDNFTVEIFDETPLRGYFEHNELGDNCAGGLWFEGKNLVDCDGVFSLPTDVIWAVRKLGFHVGKEFE